MLASIAVVLLTVVEIHAASNDRTDQRALALRRLFAYQIMLNMD